MSRIIYVNGRYRNYADAAIHAEDRGFQFADSIYEVCEIWQGRLVDETRHLDRLERSLRELAMPPPMTRPALKGVIREVIRRNRVRNGTVYLQVSRGAARRDFVFPDRETPPTLVCLARSHDPARFDALAAAGVAVKSMPDTRWARCDIKTVMLLPACLAKEAARRDGAREAWFIDRDGYVTEGASSNAWIVTANGKLVTRHADHAILPGVTRATVLDVISAEGLAIEQRAFRLTEAMAASEAFLTSASSTVMPIVRIDGTPIGDGKPGTLTQRLRARFHEVATSTNNA